MFSALNISPSIVSFKVRCTLRGCSPLAELQAHVQDLGISSSVHYSPSHSCSGAAAPPGRALTGVPTFNPGVSTGSGLDLLALAATSTLEGKDVDTPARKASGTALHVPGPYNPAAVIPSKVVKKILDLEFVEMAEITLDEDVPSTPGRPATSRLPVTDISIWLEKFSIMAAIMCTRFPEKAPELLAYQASIIRAERNYEGKQWVAYDRQFRREALARKDLDWSVPDPRLYNEAFTGRARAIPRCSFCLQDDHGANACPHNPNRPMYGWSAELPSWLAHQALAHHSTGPSAQQEICRRFNEGRCRKAGCRYRHACSGCQEPHLLVDCPQKGPSRAAARSRSPRGPRNRMPPIPFGRGY